MTRASWSLKEFQQALRMKRRGASCADIASALGRSTAAIETKFRSFASVKCIMPRTSEVTTVAIEGQAEQVVVSSRDLTSVICGDPPVGHSAFDRRGGRPPTGGSESRHYEEVVPGLGPTLFANIAAISTHTD
jgi:hypothetical protein